MKNIVIMFFCFCLFFNLHAIVQETASLKAFIYGHTANCEYDNWVSHSVEGIAIPNYNLYAPWDRQTTGFGHFYLPTADTLSLWNNVVTEFAAGNFADTENLINTYGFPYHVVEFHNTDNNQTFYMLRETIDTSFVDNNGTAQTYDDEHGSYTYGWGLYIYNPNSSKPLIINVCHPNDDFITIPIAVTAFETLDARFMILAGAGREVKYSGATSYYTNSVSLSDASRNANHPFSKAYNVFCDNIRQMLNHRELGIQVHSYDWNRHLGYADCQISAGMISSYPSLPIRDLSSLKQDMINATDFVVHPENTIGYNDIVRINDFYAINNPVHGFTYTNADTTFEVNHNVDLTGFAENKQYLKSFENWNNYDVFDPFLHIEMDELPSCYEQSTNNLKWFYGFNPLTNQYDMNILFNKALAFYTPWIMALQSVLPQVYALNDLTSPTAPESLSILNSNADNIDLQWKKTDSFDFDTYEVLYSTTPIDQNNFTVFTRNNNSELASPAFETTKVSPLLANCQYYFKIRAKDKQGNYSALSNEATGTTSSAKIANLVSFGLDGKVRIQWTAVSQTLNQGFKIYRAISENGNYSNIASWTSDPTLAGDTANNKPYGFYDTTVQNGQMYYYKISATNTSNQEFINNVVVKASPQPIYYLYLKNAAGTIKDSVAFGSNPLASDYFDTYYDTIKPAQPAGNYIYGRFHESYYDGYAYAYLARDTYADYDSQNDVRYWYYQFKTNLLNQNIYFSLSPNAATRNRHVYLYNSGNQQLLDLSNPVGIQVSAESFYTLTLYDGNLYPSVTIGSKENQFYQQGDTLSITWQTQFKQVVSSLSILLKNSSDSLTITQNLDPSTTSYSWVIPNQLTLLDAKVVIRANLIEGGCCEFYSNYSLGIVPLQINFDLPQGWSMYTNPSVNYIPELAASDQLFEYLTSDYVPSFVMQFGHGYWLHKQTASTNSAAATIRKKLVSFSLQQGWNLVANPFMSAVKVKNLQFIAGSAIYSYIQAIQMNLINPSVYCYNNEYCYASFNDIINAKSSFWVYVNAPSMQIRFSPFAENTESGSVPEYWHVSVKATQNSIDNDEIVVGCAEMATNQFDKVYDILEPPIKPFTKKVRFAIPRNYDTALLLNQDYIPALNPTAQEIVSVPVSIAIDTLQTVLFSADTSAYPSNYHVSLFINNQDYDLTHNQIAAITPTSLSFNGEIHIKNQFVANVDNSVESAFSIENYPNPFNPTTNISFTIPRSSLVNVSIYNIKGQRVKTLVANEAYSQGRHTLSWDGKNNNNTSVGSGIYFCKIACKGNGNKVVKMLLLK